MSVKSNERRDLAARLAVLCMPVAAALALPSVAMGATTGTGTVRAVVGGDGTVKTIKAYDASGNAGAFNGSLPLKLSISRSVSGNVSTYSYHVENTFSKTQDVTYTDTAGKTHTTSTTLQLPLVAQLGVEVPKSFTNVNAPNAVVQTDPDGTSRILYNLVLFSPLGSPTQDVTFTASGSGAPTAELAAKAINPTATPGLSAASQDANSSAQQDDFWSSYASGGNGGLTQLADGMTQIVAGLTSLAPGAHQLADGIKKAGAGAVQLDAGTKSAYDGSKKLYAGDKDALEGARQLADGGKQVLDGSKKLDAGTHSAFDGSKQLATGAHAASDGATKLSDGLSQIAGGNAQLATGLGQISGGLGQLADPATGLPSAVVGLQTISGALAQIIAGIGPTGSLTTPGILDALQAVSTGLKTSQTQLTTLAAGLGCAGNTIITVVNGAAAGTTPSGCASPIPVPLAGIADPFSQAVLVGTPPPGTPGVALQLLGAQQQLQASLAAPTAANPSTLPAAIGAVDGVIHALDHAATSASDPGGVKQVLTLLNGSTALGKVITGLQAAVTGVNALNTGATSAVSGAQTLAAGSASAYDGSKALATGVGQVAGGADALSSGLGQLATGQDQLNAGLAKIAPGQVSLASGLGQITDGQKQLTGGLSQLSAGQHQVATGLPAAVSGSAQIADGADQLLAGTGQVKDGILAVKSGATQPLVTQLQQGSQNAKKQVAIIEAAGALASEAPGGAGTSYVLTQSPTGFRLAASSTSASSGSNTGRNIGIGLGGLAALIVAVVAGFALGRRSGTRATV